jgi:hypothetical protein
MSTDTDLHRADPALRRLARWLPISVLLAGVLALWLLHAWLGSLEQRPDALDALLLGFLGLATLLATVGLTLAWLLWSAAGRVVAEDRYPPTDMRTLHDVPIRHGGAARALARWLRIGAVVTMLLAVGILAWALLAARAMV